jgi:hypothetical protein
LVQRQFRDGPFELRCLVVKPIQRSFWIKRAQSRGNGCAWLAISSAANITVSSVGIHAITLPALGEKAPPALYLRLPNL